MLSGAKLPKVLCCLRRNVREQLHLYSPGRLPTDGDICRSSNIASELTATCGSMRCTGFRVLVMRTKEDDGVAFNPLSEVPLRRGRHAARCLSGGAS